jgi:folate-dependent phosphoribosylglycinamide formyltransferase PurN
MMITPVFDPSTRRKMRIALFISGSGTNGLNIIEKSMESGAKFEVSLIFSDIRDSRIRKNGSKMSLAKEIAEKYNLAYECVDIRDFYKERGVKRTDLSPRPEYDELVLNTIKGYNLDLIVNAGYMSIMTPVLLDEYPGMIVNVHPADLTVMDGDHRMYIGIHVVEQAILRGDKYLKSTTHIVRKEVDGGEILVLSEPMSVEIDVSLDELRNDKKLRRKVVSIHQTKLKEMGDWVIFPMTIEMISKGRFAIGKKGVYMDGKLIPNGYQLGA